MCVSSRTACTALLILLTGYVFVVLYLFKILTGKWINIHSCCVSFSSVGGFSRRCTYPYSWACSQSCEKRLLASSCLVFLSAWNNYFTGRILKKFGIGGFLESLSRKFKVSLKYDKNNGHCAWRPMCTYLLTYSMAQSPSSEANWFAASQEIPHISRNPKVHYRTHKRPPPVCILGKPNPVHIPTSYLLEIHPNIIHPSKSRSHQWPPSIWFPHQDPIYPPLLTNSRHMPSPSHPSRFYHPHNIGWGVQII